MQTQSFLLKDPATLPSADEQTDEVKHRVGLLDEVGLSGVRRWESQDRDRLYTAQALYPEMTGGDLVLWQRFLPTRYGSLRQYSYDLPPTEALELMKTATRLDCFDRIELWTPEGNTFLGRIAKHKRDVKTKLEDLANRIDPMAVGVISDVAGREHYFQIARWGEALKPVTEIRRYVRHINWQVRLLTVVLPFVMACFGIASYVIGIQHFGFGPVVAFTLIGIGLAAVVLMLCTV